MSILPPVMPPEDGPIPPLKRLRLATEIIATYVRARWNLFRRDLSATIGELRRRRDDDATNPCPNPRVLGRRLGRAAEHTLARLPADSRCLMQSLVLSGLLARRGIDSRLVLAVRPGESFAAHAWVECDGQPLLEPADDRFGRLVEM